jgi:glycosyltransferase involved in cell wall biosynthesis
MRAAIVHYWLLNMRGGERVLEALCGLLPDADLFTLFYDPQKVSPTLRSRNIRTSFLQPFRGQYRKLLPLMPMALENFDLRDYDVVVSSESGPAKGVLVRSTARHICYCHTPMRYLWELYPEYRNDWASSRIERVLMSPLTHYLRLWDYSSAARVDQFVANSENVRGRIFRTYRRESLVIYPPVDVHTFDWRPPLDYYLIVAELVPYKRVDAAVRVFSSNGRKLRIVGEGPEYRRLKTRASSNIEFCGRVSEGELRELYSRCLALVMPGEDDFGMTAVEALASGKPVVALGRGGACETVPVEAPFGGVLYSRPEDLQLSLAIESLEAAYDRVQPEALQHWARQFAVDRFNSRMAEVLFGGEWSWRERLRSPSIGAAAANK